MTTKERVDSFHQFARDQLDRGNQAFTVDELYSLWRSRCLTNGELAESIAAITAAYADLESGETGFDARKALRENVELLGLVIGE
jgi:hypothetical protein